ncbi:MAG: (d)CMP kinase [Candidatus Delongbacteria bacterium]|nr:(d)CMP kinase [Candidatus Delongbacteria bacterium]MBN2835187.1 (d)CMP kinase [Candidatus Delongbacteria bacterium]
MIIAIDGPAASGKSTTAKLAGQKLGFLYIDTGAMYRAMTLNVKNNKINYNDRDGIIGLIEHTKIDQTLDLANGNTKTFLNGIDVSEEIRTPEISRGVGPVCEIREVRESLVSLQRIMGSNQDVILDGRDIGTVVFPNAELKFWMIADVDVRAKRRFDELSSKGIDVDFKSIKDDLIERDRRDSQRDNSPMKPADDAFFLDTSALSIDEQVEVIVKEVRRIKNL